MGLWHVCVIPHLTVTYPTQIQLQLFSYSDLPSESYVDEINQSLHDNVIVNKTLFGDIHVTTTTANTELPLSPIIHNIHSMIHKA